MSIDLERSGHVAVITINRPDRLNAMDAEHYRLLSDAWVEVRDDAEVRVVVVTGAGDRSFSAGADLRSSEPVGGELEEFWFTQKGQLLNRGLEVWKPVVAAVNGHCLGGGLTLLLATDVRVAASHAAFGLPEVRRGLLPGNGGTQRLLEQVPYALGMEMLLTGEPVDAENALRLGLVNRVVEGDEVMDTAMDYATRIAANAPLAVQAAKEMAVRSRDVDRATGLRMEQAMNRLLRGTEDVAEGRRAFAQKRDPRYLGR